MCTQRSSLSVEARLADQILRNNPYTGVNASNVRHFASLVLKNKLLQPAVTELVTNYRAFPCNVSLRSSAPPTNARKLLPGDVGVVATLGDSVAAGFGALATSIFGVFTEYRGHTFSNGGVDNYDKFVTVPNILRKYNPNLQGFSVGTGGADSQNAKLNVAVSGARSYDLLSQITALEAKMKASGVSMDLWKVVTIFVGGNDLCDYCSDTTKNSPQNYMKNIEVTLDMIKSKFPKVFVNLVGPPDVTLLSQVSSGLCSILHVFECGCADDAGTRVAHAAYTQKLSELIDLPKFNDKADFFVTLQPFLKDLQLPRDSNGNPDSTYFAPDCFHFSGKAHQAAAVALWNNMVEARANKKTTWVPGEPLECPTTYLM